MRNEDGGRTPNKQAFLLRNINVDEFDLRRNKMDICEKCGCDKSLRNKLVELLKELDKENIAANKEYLRTKSKFDMGHTLILSNVCNKLLKLV